MPDSLTVHLNREGPQSIEAPRTVEATGNVKVYLRNHGTPLHAHVRLGSSLSKRARVTTPNRYVEAGATRVVSVEVEEGDRPIEGRLEIVTGYGAETAYVSVTVYEPGAVEPEVSVDEELGQPSSPPDAPGIAPERLLLGALVGVAALVAVAAVVLIQNLLAAAGVVVVLAGVVLAGYLLVE